MTREEQCTDATLIPWFEICTTPNDTKIIGSWQSYLGLQNTGLVPSDTLFWATCPFRFAIPTPVAWSLSSVGEDVLSTLLPPACAQEWPVGLLWAVHEKGAVGFRSPGLYGGEATRLSVPPLLESPPGQVTLCTSKEQDRVTRAQKWHCMGALVCTAWYSKLKGTLFVLECPSSSRSQVRSFCP